MNRYKLELKLWQISELERQFKELGYATWNEFVVKFDTKMYFIEKFECMDGQNPQFSVVEGYESLEYALDDLVDM
ncbi:hypothetical protein [Vagococcus fluvialis]|uniref:hypothetical protein n=1 Tax=Vagococcus fluvialis TaxID=2738 RepID=UPI001D0AD3A0|nr:hypothetical protein [Vagococcus fluvialis]UDM72779.1 hypothetical protein K5L00_14590 [Vagococcus fluvialis]UDM78335.1 hypothetical protein K5K98_14795 [Vagococcus fluvialis]UDM84054.1 hypothetical protein K5K96_14615 [Vagococcus fluvialis]